MPSQKGLVLNYLAGRLRLYTEVHPLSFQKKRTKKQNIPLIYKNMPSFTMHADMYSRCLYCRLSIYDLIS